MAEAVVVPTWAPGAKYDIWTGVLPWTTTAWKVALLQPSFVLGPGITLFSEVSSSEVSGSGYTAGGYALTGLQYGALTPTSFRLTITDSTISPSGTLDAGWAVVYDSVSGRVAFFVEFAGTKTATATSDFILDWGNNLDSGGFTWTESTLHASVGAYADNSESAWNAFTTFLGRPGQYKPQYAAQANISSWSGVVSTTTSILNPLLFPRTGGMVIVLIVPPKLSGQTFQQAAETTVNQSTMEAIGQAIEDSGVANPRADGRPSLIFINGQEANGSGYFQFQPQNDTDAAYYATMIEQNIGWIKGKIRAENRNNVKFALSFKTRDGASAGRLQIMLSPSIDLIDQHIYDDDEALYANLSQAGKDANEAAVWTKNYSGTQGLLAAYNLAVANDLPFMMNEWGVQNTSNKGNTGGGDHPNFINNVIDFIEDFPLADGRLSGFSYTFTNSASSGQFHNKLGTTEFPLATAAFLARLA